MDKTFMIDTLIDLSRLDLFIQKQHFSQNLVFENLDQLVFGFSLIIDFIDFNASNQVSCKALPEMESFLHHAEDYSIYEAK